MSCPSLRPRKLHLRIGGEIIQIRKESFEFQLRNANRTLKIGEGKAVMGLVVVNKRWLISNNMGGLSVPPCFPQRFFHSHRALARWRGKQLSENRFKGFSTKYTENR
jgi:hypothetical protein